MKFCVRQLRQAEKRYVPLKPTVLTLTEINTNQPTIIRKCGVYTFLFWFYFATTFNALMFNSWLDNLCLKYFYIIKHFALNLTAHNKGFA